MQADEILARLKALSDPKAVEGMARFGINPENTYGVSVPDLRKLARETGKVRLLACSASVQYLGLELEDTARKVDEVVGLATILRVAQDAAEVIYI